MCACGFQSGQRPQQQQQPRGHSSVWALHLVERHALQLLGRGILPLWPHGCSVGSKGATCKVRGSETNKADNGRGYGQNQGNSASGVCEGNKESTKKPTALRFSLGAHIKIARLVPLQKHQMQSHSRTNTVSFSSPLSATTGAQQRKKQVGGKKHHDAVGIRLCSSTHTHTYVRACICRVLTLTARRMESTLFSLNTSSSLSSTSKS